MPQSKNRPGHQHHSHRGTKNPGNPKIKSSPVIIALVFFAVLGLGISYFVGEGSTTALVIGAVVGAAIGYIFGQQVKQSMSKKDER